MKIADLSMCSGCGACSVSCPKGAIEFQKDILAKRLPTIDEKKCIQCNLCVKTCPINQNFFMEENEEKKCYALQAKNKMVIEGSSSGGVATIIARYIINKNGRVFGCRFDKELNLNYVECSTTEDIETIKGSKYVQSNLITCYSKIKSRLDEGKKVLVIGVPCQIAGIRGYLKKNYDNLFLVDLICHGTPPIEYLKEHVSNLKKGKISDVKFRGEKGFTLSLFSEGKEVYNVKSKEDEYFYGFLEGVIYRDNCYHCPYATIKRISDITIGDFWGLDRETTKHKFKGPVSVGIINTKKGMSVFEEIKDSLLWEERLLEEAIKENEQLRNPMKPDEYDRRIFVDNYPRLGYDRAFRKTVVYRKKMRIYRWKERFLRTQIGKNSRKLWKKIKRMR